MSEHGTGSDKVRHDLRTPLTAILGYGQLLEMEELTPTQSDAVREILAAGRQLLDMIDNLKIDDRG